MNLNMKILIIDDFSTMRRIVRNILKQIGFTNVIEADNGKVALKVLKKENIDLVLCDWNMPEMPGIDLLKTIKAASFLGARCVLVGIGGAGVIFDRSGSYEIVLVATAAGCLVSVALSLMVQPERYRAEFVSEEPSGEPARGAG